MINQQQASHSLVLVKASYQEEKRKFQLVKDEQQFSFANLLDKLKTVFSLEKQVAFKVSYLDSDKDEIVIASDAELLAAILDQNANSTELLRLAVIIQLPTSKQVAATTTTTTVVAAEQEEKKRCHGHHRGKKHHHHHGKKHHYHKKESSSDDSEKSSEDEEKKTDEKHEDKKLAKEQRKAEREAAKQAKKLQREQEKQARQALKGDTFDLTEAQVWPNAIRTLHVDGNNMMFMTGTLRGLCLGRKKQACESVLSQMVNAFRAKSGTDKSILWFDATVHTSNADTNALVLSAQPMFPSTDHAMIDLASKMSKEQLASTAFVTSDNALRESLKKLGAHVLRTKAFLQFVFFHVNAAHAGKFAKPDEWIATLNNTK